LKAGYALTFIVLWWAEEESRCAPIDVEELVEAGYYSRATAFRRQADFRQAFEAEGFKSPHDLAMALPQRTKSAPHVARLAV
jgi:hypothetical protein